MQKLQEEPKLTKKQKITATTVGAAFIILRFAIVIYLIQSIWGQLEFPTSLMVFFVALNFVSDKWFPAINRLGMWAMKKASGQPTGRKSIDIGYKGMAQKEIDQLQKRIEELEKVKLEGVTL